MLRDDLSSLLHLTDKLRFINLCPSVADVPVGQEVLGLRVGSRVEREVTSRRFGKFTSPAGQVVQKLSYFLRLKHLETVRVGSLD